MPEVEFLPLDTGENTKANIDFYYIKFARPGDRNIEDLFKELRTNFGSIITGISTDYGFGPYKSSADPQGKTNEKMWKSDNPLNAVMSFNLDTPLPATMISRISAGNGPISGPVRYVVSKAGDLQVTCATKTDFVFSTVKSKNGGPHPVSGNRGFGLADNGDGTWTFYSKAVDRLTTGYNPKILLAFDVFCKGHRFWESIFYPGMKKYLEHKGLTVREIWTQNHGPVPFPFEQGPPVPTMQCD